MLDTAPTLDELAAQARQKFAEVYGRRPRWVVAAPGRVNLIGEHTDYNDGFVLPMAIERYVVIAADQPTTDAAPNSIEAYSELIDERQTFTVDGSGPKELPGWCVYLHGPLDLMHQRGSETGPLQLAVLSTVPQGGGLSSSAALEVATATLVEAVTGKSLPGPEKAKLCQQAENEYAGVPCGIMDQFASACCQAGEAMQIDCRSLETTPTPLSDPELVVLIINSNVKHDLGSSEYPVRRAQCESAAKKLGVAALRDASIEQLEARKDDLSELEYLRARHAISANDRVAAFSRAAALGDWRAAGRQMDASHASLRDDYEVSCPEVDALVDLTSQIGVDGGVYGSRITGGGFGGCTVSLVDAARVEQVVAHVLPRYQEATGLQANAFVSRPARGAQVLD